MNPPLSNWLGRILAQISLSVLLSPEAIGLYGLFGLFLGALIGNVALVMLGVGCLLFFWRSTQKQDKTD